MRTNIRLARGIEMTNSTFVHQLQRLPASRDVAFLAAVTTATARCVFRSIVNTHSVST